MKGALLLAAALGVVALGALAARGPQRPAAQRWSRGLPQRPDHFPIGVWLQDPVNARQYKNAGVNLYIGLWGGPTEAQLKQLADAGMPVICDQNEYALKNLDNATIVGWMHGDEPDNAQPVKAADGSQTWGPCIPPQRIVDDYGRIRERDPSRPVLLNLGQGVANDEWIGRGEGARLSDYETYVKGCDIVSFDVYPVAGLDRPDGDNFLWLVPKGIDRLVKWTGGTKPVWAVIEVSRINSDRRVSPAQLRAQVWMAVIHGARGLIYFTHEWKPKFSDRAVLDDAELLPAFRALNAQLTRLAPAINAARAADAVAVTSSSGEVPIDVLATRLSGSLYVFAAGMRNGGAVGTFRIKGVPDGTRVEVVDEQRTLTVSGGAFKDDFAPHGVHIYRVATGAGRR